MCFSKLADKLTLKRLLLLAAIAAAAVLGAALVAQYGFNLHPCELCLYQRYPYAAIIALGLFGALAAKSPKVQRWLIIACGLLFVLDGGIAFYHAGVEWGIFPGPTACSSTGSGEQTLEEMRHAIMNAPLVPCNQPMATFLGLSMAAWNAAVAALLALSTFCALRQSGKKT